ncbi:MAG: hypothetical protein JNM34_06215 [Chthonomonadaceae bacterium]|nr:hypothetical protein [Chthonomonadaceae bacterium]
MTLGLGTSVVTRAGPGLAKESTARVTSKSWKPGPTKVYNFQVAGTHTYYVVSGGTAKWVHNKCGTDPGHHIIPKQVRDQLEGRTGPMKEYDHTVPLRQDIHRDIHSGKGQGKGGHYNNWWRERIDSVGGVGNVTRDHVQEWYDEISDLFGYADGL